MSSQVLSIGRGTRVHPGGAGRAGASSTITTAPRTVNLRPELISDVCAQNGRCAFSVRVRADLRYGRVAGAGDRGEPSPDQSHSQTHLPRNCRATMALATSLICSTLNRPPINLSNFTSSN